MTPERLCRLSVAAVVAIIMAAGLVSCTFAVPRGDGKPPLPTAPPTTTAHATPTAVPTVSPATPARGSVTPSAIPASRTPTAATTTTTPPVAPTRTGTRAPVPTTDGKLLFGLGPMLDSASTSPIADQLGMFTTWYNSQNDLGFIRGWRDGLIPQVYSSRRAIHLVVWLGGAGKQTTVQTSHGPACGRDYPLLPAFLADARELATIFKGAAGGPPLYVTLFTELQTYPCSANTWAATPEVTNYYLALQDQYLAALDIFHTVAPNSRVSLGWGGWQARWDDPAAGGGRSLVQKFADVLRASDFQSFQAMQNDTNADDILAMTKLLGAYGPVMVAHYKPDSGAQGVWVNDMRTMFTDDYMAKVTAAGLFAFSFMDQHNLASDAGSLQLTRDVLARYGTKTT